MRRTGDWVLATPDFGFELFRQDAELFDALHDVPLLKGSFMGFVVGN